MQPFWFFLYDSKEKSLDHRILIRNHAWIVDWASSSVLTLFLPPSTSPPAQTRGLAQHPRELPASSIETCPTTLLFYSLAVIPRAVCLYYLSQFSQFLIENAINLQESREDCFPVHLRKKGFLNAFLNEMIWGPHYGYQQAIGWMKRKEFRKLKNFFVPHLYSVSLKLPLGVFADCDVVTSCWPSWG